jgi:hypothetical protein
MGRVRRVRARVDAACGYDAEKEDRVPDVVERVDAYALAALQAQRPEASGELSDRLVGAAGGDVVGRVEGGDVDLTKMMRLGWAAKEENGSEDQRWEAYGIVPVVGQVVEGLPIR